MHASRQWLRLVLAGILIAGSAFPAAARSAFEGFADSSNSYAAQEIDELAKSGIMTGYGDGTFRPERTVTRAETARLLVRSMGLKPDPEGADEFLDVSSDAWYRGDVGALAQAGIARGTGMERFSPETTVSREELISFFIRALGMESTANELVVESEAAEKELSDFADTAEWAKPYVALAYRIGFVRGAEQADGSLVLRPKAPVDRQAAARLTYEYYANRDVYRSRAVEGVADEQGPNVTAVTVPNRNTVRVTFDAAVSNASAERFRFEPQLAITSAVRSEDDNAVVVLSTEEQKSGTVYKLFYQGKDTGFTVVGASGAASSSGSNNGGGVEPGAAELLASGGEIAAATIRVSGTYGPSDESGLRTKVTGTLTIDPGPEGEVTLRNIEPENMVVLSGKDESIKLQQTVIKQLRVNAVNNGGTPVRIETKSGSEVNAVEVESQAILESTSTTGKLGTIKLTTGAASKTITLRGNVTGDVQVEAPGSTIKLEPPSAGSDALSTKVKTITVRTTSSIQAAANAEIEDVSVAGTDTTLSLGGAGTIDTVTVDASATGAVLSLGAGTNIATIQADTNVKLSGDPTAIAKTQVAGTGTVAVADTVKNQVIEKAVSNADAAIAGIGTFVAYSDGLQAKIDQAAALVQLAKKFGAEDGSFQRLTDLTAIQAAVAELKSSVETDIGTLTVPATATNSLSLPTSGANGTQIVWASDNANVVQPNGTVVRPAAGSDKAHVNLTATVSKLGYSKTRSFDVTVPAVENSPTVTELVYDPSVTVTEATYLSTYPLELLARFSDDSTASVAHLANWTSLHPNVATVSSAGLLTIVGGGKVSLTATYEGLTARFEVTVIPKAELTYELSGSVWTSLTKEVVAGNISGEIKDSAIEPGCCQFTIPAGNTHEYLIVGLKLPVDLDSDLGAVVTGLTEEAEVADIYSSSTHVIIYHGGLAEGTYTVTLAGLKRKDPADGVVRYIRPLQFTLVKQ